MRSIPRLTALLAALSLIICSTSLLWAGDYESRFVKNYPPGYYGMYYYAQRFFNNMDPTNKSDIDYRWDRYMSNVTEVHFPFYPVPYDWEYGSKRTFNLPNYNTNDWP